MVQAQRLRQLVAVQAGQGLHRLLYGGQPAPRAARALEWGGFEVLDARVHGKQSPATATIANRPPFVKAFAQTIVRRMLSHGEATPCVPTPGQLVLADCPTSQVNAIGSEGAGAPVVVRGPQRKAARRGGTAKSPETDPTIPPAIRPYTRQIYIFHPHSI